MEAVPKGTKQSAGMTDEGIDAFGLQKVECFGVGFLFGLKGCRVDGGILEFIRDFKGPDLTRTLVDPDSNRFAVLGKKTSQVRTLDVVKMVHC
jgi:hypothetical protein